MNPSFQRAALGLAFVSMLSAASAQGIERTEQYRLTLNLTAPITTNFDAHATLGFFANPDHQSENYRLQWPAATWLATYWLQFTGGMLTQYEDNRNTADELLLRPFAGPRLFVPNQAHLVLFNFTRYEYVATENLDSGSWRSFSRIRSQFVAEVPLTSGERAWKPETWYTLVSVEPFYRFDTHQFTPVRVGGGIGRILKDKIRVELTYQAQFTQAGASGLQWTGNIIQLNLRFGLKEGVLGRLLNPTEKE
jgi:hypothetical protein